MSIRRKVYVSRRFMSFFRGVDNEYKRRELIVLVFMLWEGVIIGLVILF